MAFKEATIYRMVCDCCGLEADPVRKVDCHPSSPDSGASS